MTFAATSPADLDRASRLRRMKLVAVGLLLVAAAIYLLTLPVAEEAGWGFVNAAAEAAMVGALADWFAVTALFRHPLGLPIPHTAIIPRRKDDIARSLQDFIGEHFLTAPVVTERLLAADVAVRLAHWLQRDGSAERVVAEASRVAVIGLDQLDADDVTAFARDLVLPRLSAQPMAGLAGNLLDEIVTDGAHHGLVDLVVGELHDWLRHHPETFMAIVEERAPRWSPPFLNRQAARWAYDQAVDGLARIRRDPNHATRRALDDLLRQVAQDLRSDPVVAARAEALKVRLLEHPQTAETVGALVASVQASLRHALDDPESSLRASARGAVHRFGDRLLADEPLRNRLEARLADLTGFAVTRYGPELTTVISHTIDRWDGRQAAARIELHIGRDLQFIRINGTIVGALAGVAIHAVSQLFS